MSNIKTNIAYQFFYRALTVITPLITTPIITRALGAERLGVYSATMAFTNYFMLLAMLGIEKYGQRMVASAKTIKEKQGLFWEIFSIQFICSCVTLLIYYCFSALWPAGRSEIMMIQGLWIVSCLFDINWFFWGLEEFKITVIRNCVFKIITVALIVLFVRNSSDLLLYCGIMAGGTVATQIILWLPLRKYIGFEKIKISTIKKHMPKIMILFIPVIALSIYHIMDKTMLDILSTEEQSGYYYVVDKIINIPLALVTAVSTVMLPRMSYIFSNDSIDNVKKMLNKSIELALFLICAIGFGIPAISKEFIPLFFGKGYEPCIKLVYIFMPVLLVKSLSDIVRNQFLIPARMDKQYIVAVFGGAIANIICNLCLIPSFGAIGAAIGTFVAELMVLLVQTWYCRNTICFYKVFLSNLVYVLCGVLLLIAVKVSSCIFELRGVFGVVIMIIIGGAVYMLGSILVVMTKKESIFMPYLQKLKNYCKKQE